MGQPRPRKIRLGDGAERRTGLRPRDDQGVHLRAAVLQRQTGDEAVAEVFAVVPLRGAGRDQRHAVRRMPQNRHLRQHAAAMVGEIGQPDPARRGQPPGDQAEQPLVGAPTGQLEPREARKVEDADAVPDRLAFRPDARLPRPGAVPGAGRRLAGVVARRREPVRPLPAVVGAHPPARRPDPRMDRRQSPVGPGGPAMPREMHGVFVAVDLPGLGEAVVGIGVPGETARIAGPHVPFGGALGHPFGKHLAGPARLSDPEGEDAGLERVRDARHRPDQRVAVGRVGDRTVDDFGQPGLGQNGHAPDGVGDVRLQPVEIVRKQLKAEILRKRVLGPDPVRATVALVGAKIETGLLLPQVIGHVHVAQQRQLPPGRFRPVPNGRNLLEHEILVAHDRHRHRAASEGQEPVADAPGVVSCGVDDELAADVALLRMDHPFVARAADPSRRPEPLDPGAQSASPPGERLGQLRGVHVPVRRIVKRPGDVVGFEERVA